MGYVYLKDDEVTFALNQLKILKEYQPILFDNNFIKDNINSINSLISNISSSLPDKYRIPLLIDYSKSECRDIVPITNDNGEYIIRNSDNDELLVPFEYSNYYLYLVNTFSRLYVENQQSFWDSLYQLFINIIEIFMKKEKSLFSQISHIVKEADLFYSRLRDNISLLQDKYDDKTFDFVFLLPDYFIYACRLLADKNIPKEAKAEIVLTIVYLISPIDFIPEAFIPHPIAFMDDAFICLYVINRSMEGGYVSRETFLKHWPGRPSTVDYLVDWFNALENLLGNKFALIWHFLVNKLRDKEPCTSE